MGVHISQLPQEVKDRLGLKDPQHKQFWAIIGSKDPIYFRSSWEYYYAIFLEKLRQEGKIVDWKHEPKCFWFENIKRGVRSARLVLSYKRIIPRYLSPFVNLYLPS